MNLSASALVTKVIFGMATAGALWATSTLVDGKITNTLQDAQLQRHEETLKKIDTLSDQLSEANKHMAVLETRFNDEVKHEPRQ